MCCHDHMHHNILVHMCYISDKDSVSNAFLFRQRSRRRDICIAFPMSSLSSAALTFVEFCL